MTIVEHALPLVECILAPVEALFAALDVALGDLKARLALAEVGRETLDCDLGVLLGARKRPVG
jgi:hypothetical protein